MKILETRLYQYIDLLILRYPQLIVAKDCIVEAYQILEESYTNDGKLLVAGNGGSAADAEHIVGELMKGFVNPRKLEAEYSDALITVNKGKCYDHPKVDPGRLPRNARPLSGVGPIPCGCPPRFFHRASLHQKFASGYF